MNRFTAFAAALASGLALAAGASANSPVPSAPFTQSHTPPPGAAFAARYGPSRTVVMHSCMTDSGSPTVGGANGGASVCGCVTGVVMRALPHLGGTQLTMLARLFLSDQPPGYAWQDLELWMPRGYLPAYFHCTGATYPIRLGSSSVTTTSS